MQAIETKYLPCTNSRGARIKASCERGSITIDYPHELVAKFAAEDEAKYGPEQGRNPWLADRVCGQLPSHNYAHVFAI